MSDEISITYETLFEVLRLEKNRLELQKLDEDFYEKAAEYLRDKTSMKDSEPDLEVASKQISNTKKLISDIFYRRIKKIISSAYSIVVAPNSVVDKDNMLEIEKEFYEGILDGINGFKSALLMEILQGKVREKPKKEVSMVRFIRDVPKFIGKDLEQYGPFKAEDITSLPDDLAQILIKKGSAEEINT